MLGILFAASWMGGHPCCLGADRTMDGFAIPDAGHRFEFPRDHGSHPEFKIEWWYLTGHLFGEKDRRFGFQATFFRRSGGTTPGGRAGVNPDFALDQLYLAHMAILDVRDGEFIYQTRLNRSGWDAGAATNGLQLQNGNWYLRESHPTPATGESNVDGDPARLEMELFGSVRGEGSFRLALVPLKPLVIFGTNGVSRKGADPSAASYYLTFPRLSIAGELVRGAISQKVRGEGWMDHEISSSQLSGDQTGWDWACLQFRDGRELMAYRLRQKHGASDPFSTLAWVATNGVVRHYGRDEFRWETVRSWTSPVTRTQYPVSVRLRTVDPQTGTPAVYTLEPLNPRQELTDPLGGVAYWEGGCRVLNADNVDVGQAYLELSGYAGDLAGKLK